MATPKDMQNMKERIETIEDVLAAAASGDFSAQIAVDVQETHVLTSVETGINLLISDLGEEIQDSQKHAEKLQDKLDIIQKQRHAIQELSTPVIPIWDDIVILPLIGTVDTQRAQQILNNLLEAVSETQAQVAIIDISGVPMVDTKVAQHFLITIEAVKMLGAETILTGVSPYNAQTLVKLGVDLTKITTKASLHAGLLTAFDITKNKITKK